MSSRTTSARAIKGALYGIAEQARDLAEMQPRLGEVCPRQGATFPVDQVLTSHAFAAYSEALGCPVRFRQTWCGFDLLPRLADRRIESADPETRRIAAKYLESQYPPRTALVLAIRTASGQFVANPAADTRLDPDTVLIVLGTSAQLRLVRSDVDPVR